MLTSRDEVKTAHIVLARQESREFNGSSIEDGCARSRRPPGLAAHGCAVAEDAGFEAIEAADADEAVRILESRDDIRLVFTDIDMPGSMDGMKLAATVRDRWPPVEIILTSGHIAAQNVTLPERGVFFPKPYDAREVSQAMRRMIG
jgi:CheY-like chemotaxis protein